MNLGDPVFAECEVAVLSSQPGVDPGDVLGELGAVAVRHEPVALSLPQLHRHADRS